MNATVEKIHKAFDEAQDWLLQEAEKFEEKQLGAQLCFNTGTEPPCELIGIELHAE